MSAEYVDLNAGVASRRTGLPTRIITDIGVCTDPTPQQCYAQGWRQIVSIDDPTPGFIVTAYGIQELTAETCKLTVASEYNPVEEAARRRAAKIATMPDSIKLGYAPDMRTRLRAHFPDLTPPAEQNTTIGETYIALYFKAKRDAGTITAADDADILLLQKDFAELNAWWGTGATNTDFPWEAVP